VTYFFVLRLIALRPIANTGNRGIRTFAIPVPISAGPPIEQLPGLVIFLGDDVGEAVGSGLPVGVAVGVGVGPPGAERFGSNSATKASSTPPNVLSADPEPTPGKSLEPVKPATYTLSALSRVIAIAISSLTPPR
jgi:hypothetical protein